MNTSPRLLNKNNPSTTNVKVAVRVRPFNKSEIRDGIQNVVTIDPENHQCRITNPASSDERTFTFDYVYDSSDESSPNYATQDTIWNDLGQELLDAAWAGYNYSLFAYGQTGTGKSYSMLGFGLEKSKRGILPRACESIFEKISSSQSSDITYKVEVSMLEIYNERIRDLFVPINTQSKCGLKLRDTPKTGPYVEGLKSIAVEDSDQIERLLDFGARNRTLAVTKSNESSSRAHTIFTIKFVATMVDRTTMKASDKTSKIHLVDLAGSERVRKTGAEGVCLTEGGYINKSLSALGNVINALASKGKNKNVLVPYRDAVLTHLLKSSLGGNAKTTMIAAISPADTSFAESLSTLRYANRAKQIRNVAVVNEDPNERLIRQLQEEMESLRSQLKTASSGVGTEEIEMIRKELEQSFRRKLEIERVEWEKERKEAEDALRMDGGGGGRNEEGLMDNVPCISNLNDDEALTGVLKFYLERHEEYIIGSGKEENQDEKKDGKKQTIVIGGMGVKSAHALIMREKVNDENESSEHNYSLSISCFPDAETMLNGVDLPCNKKRVLHNGDRLIFGKDSVFKVVIPIKDEHNQQSDTVQVDYAFAMKEASASRMAKLEQEKRESAIANEKKRIEMEETIKQLEERLKYERLQLTIERDTKVEILKMQDDLEEQLNLQTIETEKLRKKQQKWKFFFKGFFKRCHSYVKLFSYALKQKKKQ